MNTPSRSPWREPLVWLLVALPALSVVAAFALLFFAEDTIDSVADPVQHVAQVQVADLSPDLEARRLGLAAAVERMGDRIVVVPRTAGFDRGARLELRLHHPVREAEDRSVTLVATPDGWSGHLASLDATHDWNLELAPLDRRWRLLGRWPAHANKAPLRPSLASP
ncbi:FixH family protein [Lysobacter sp. KIS68-7]|uniref:FixH family protein n=1 Tax=Lysobacter sp. KIS68-7 TaxID=2904252 RepID=UPI001E618869|nr:FixH family protein [Lysobacter sp. KIS68-7]UHQ20063.1 FixH family protein [Lysobacter sp. KIS68-7]